MRGMLQCKHNYRGGLCAKAGDRTMPPLSLLIKPASGNCNMRCRYCFYIDETKNRTSACVARMSDDTMRALIDKAMLYADGDCTFAFQ